MRTWRRRAAAILALALAAAGLWRASTDRASEPRPLIRVTVGLQTWTGYLLLHVAQSRGFFRDEGLDVELKPYASLQELSADYEAGRVQARANLTLEAVAERLRGVDHRVILALDYSSGSDAIVGVGGVRSVADLVGKRVGFEPDTMEEFFLAWTLQRYGLSLKDVVAVHGDTEKTAAWLTAGTIDACVTHDPYLSKLLQGRARLVFSSADAPGLITDVLTVRSDALRAFPGLGAAFLRAYFRAFDLWKSRPDEAYAVLAERYAETPKALAEQMRGITMLDLADNRAAFTFATGLQSLYGNMRKVGAFVREQKPGFGVQPLETDSLVDSAPVRTIFNERRERP